LRPKGLTWAQIRAKLDCGDSYIARWSQRFAADRLAGLFARYAGRVRYNVTDRIEARVLAWTTNTPRVTDRRTGPRASWRQRWGVSCT
jgi:hypothetical protein